MQRSGEVGTAEPWNLPGRLVITVQRNAEDAQDIQLHFWGSLLYLGLLSGKGHSQMGRLSVGSESSPVEKSGVHSPRGRLCSSPRRWQGTPPPIFECGPAVHLLMGFWDPSLTNVRLLICGTSVPGNVLCFLN